MSEILILKIDKCFVWQSLPRKINLKKFIKSDTTERAPILYSSPISETFVMYFTEWMLVGVRRTKDWTEEIWFVLIFKLNFDFKSGPLYRVSKEGWVCVYDYQQGICFDNYKAYTQNFRFTNKASHFWVLSSAVTFRPQLSAPNTFYIGWQCCNILYINLLLNCYKATFKKWSIIDGCQMFWLSPRHFSTGREKNDSRG